jgi:hypothetical protein
MGIFRLLPRLPPQAMKTYKITAPLETHWRPATCIEVQCEMFLRGWQTIVPTVSPQADYIRADRSRSAREERQDGGMSTFTFGPGQTCFRPHQARLDREERFLVRGGDWRGNPRGERAELTASQWQEDCAEHFDKLKTALERG